MLTVENLSCLYAGRGVFAPVSFTVAPQEIVVLRGRNGIGKTSLLRTLAGLPVDYTGNYTVENEAHHKSLQRKGRITSESWYPDFYSPLYIPYSPPLNPHLTVSEQLTYWEHLYKNTYQKNTQYLSQLQRCGRREPPQGSRRVHLRTRASLRWNRSQHNSSDVRGIDDFFLLQHQRNTLCAKLSAGQRQILSLSRLLFFASNSCKLWLLDEPTTALDSVAEKKFYALLAKNKENGGSCVIATHQNLGVETDKTIELQQFTENSSQDIFAAWQL